MSQRAPFLSLADAALLVGFEGKPKYAARRLRRLIVAKEKATRKPILIRTTGPNGFPRYRVTLWELRRRMPELFDRRDDAERAARTLIREEIRDVMSKMAKLDVKVSYMGKRMVAILRQSMAREGPQRTAKKPLVGKRALGRGRHRAPGRP